MNTPENFAISNLVVFAGIASALLTNVHIGRDFNLRNPYVWCITFFLIGTIGILLYGVSKGASINNIDINGTSLVIGYAAIFIGTCALLLISLIFLIKSE